MDNLIPFNRKPIADEVSDRLLEAKNGKPKNKSSVFVKDGIIYMNHQNTIISFTPEQGLAMSEGLMTIAWELIEEAKQQENEDEEDTGSQLRSVITGENNSKEQTDDT